MNADPRTGQSVHFDRLEQRLRDAAEAVPALRGIRAAAFERFRALGFPTQRDEEWRSTNLRPVVETPFETAPAAGAAAAAGVAAARELLTGLAHIGEEDPALVFVNGRHNGALSRLTDLPGGCVAGSLAGAVASGDAEALANFDAIMPEQRNAFAELNTAFFEDGAYVFVPRDGAPAHPLHLVFLTLPGGGPAAAHPRVLIVAGEGSSVRVVETHAGPDGAVYHTNPRSDVLLGGGARVDHYRLQADSRGAFHTANLHAELGRGSAFASHVFALGGALMRSDIRVRLAGEGAAATLNGLSIATGEQHTDAHTVIDHALPHCSSREEYRTIAAGAARGVFTGRIIVREDAQKTDAKQSNHSLLLSDTASVDARPQLEIFADDVRCTHGATVGRLSEEALFYMQSRGIAAGEARAMLTAAFAGDLINRVEVESLRAALDRLMHERLRSI